MDELIRTEEKYQSEYERLKAQLHDLRAEVSTLTARRDELVLRECPRIQAEFDAKIGELQTRVFAAENRVRMLKRAIEILQAARNRQEQKSSEEAEKQAKQEYQKYEEDLKHRYEDMHHSREYREREEEQERRWQAEHADAGSGRRNGTESCGGNSEGHGTKQHTSGAGTEGSGAKYRASEHENQKGPKRIGEKSGAGGSGFEKHEKAGSGPEQGEQEQSKERTFRTREDELKYYYRFLMKRLHPDANPNQTEEDAELLRQTMEAYENGDLDKLKEIYQAIRDRRPESDFKDTPEDLAEMRRIIGALAEKKASLAAEIDRILHSDLYQWKAILEDEERVSGIQQMLKEKIAACEQQYQELLARYRKMKEEESA